MERTVLVAGLAALLTLIPHWTGTRAEVVEPEQHGFVFYIELTKGMCQLAVWVEDEKGTFVDTVYVTRKIAKKGLGNRKGGIDDKMGGSRLSALPVWAHRRGVDYGGGNFYPEKEPPKDKALPDAVTSATPGSGEFKWTWNPEKVLAPGRYHFYIEVNKSFDDNDAHDYSWYRGQPSVIWQGTLVVGDALSTAKAKIIGHGDPAGANGNITSDVSTLTTALELVARAEGNYYP